MTNTQTQQAVFELVKREGESDHPVGSLQSRKGFMRLGCIPCDKEIPIDKEDAAEFRKEHPTFPDLTTPDGAFWLMARLPEWDRFEEFCVDWTMGNYRPTRYGIVIHLLTWLGSDPSALFKAICEFEGLEVEG